MSTPISPGDKCPCGQSLPWHLLELGIGLKHICSCERAVVPVAASVVAPPAVVGVGRHRHGPVAAVTATRDQRRRIAAAPRGARPKTRVPVTVWATAEAAERLRRGEAVTITGATLVEVRDE